MMKCNFCGNKNDEDSRYCVFCGRRINQSRPNDTLDLTKDKDRVSSWSWGAFGLSFIYLFSMNVKLWWIFVLPTIIMVPLIVYLNNQSYAIILLGIDLALRGFLASFAKGWAWNQNHNSINIFFRKQIYWDFSGIVAFFLVYGIAISLEFYGSFNWITRLKNVL